jgi:hypothetical protein
MRQSELAAPSSAVSPIWATWTVRRARLVDVPAVARLLGVPHVAHPMMGSSTEAITSATRLILTHVALDLGEFWVAVDGADRVLAAVVLLPPGETGQQRFRLALRLELGLLLPTEPAQAQIAGVPDDHWLLLPVAGVGTEPMLADWMLAELLTELLAAALPVVDASGLPVLCLQPGRPSRALAAAGFRPLAEPMPGVGAAALRPALEATIVA